MPFFMFASLLIGVYSKRKEFAKRSIFFSLRVDFILKSYFVQGSKLEITKVVSLAKIAGKHGGVSRHLKKLCPHYDLPKYTYL